MLLDDRGYVALLKLYLARLVRVVERGLIFPYAMVMFAFGLKITGAPAARSRTDGRASSSGSRTRHWPPWGRCSAS
ncbi:hypothetical protein ACQPYK_25825 [Streptosporangium sp. CA-135522]|uniref:hypothetical protein n=1 Tax=Streptosporangium sp. CA-135522 TaxID=3240072 RepID=UPI003D8A568B